MSQPISDHDQALAERLVQEVALSLHLPTPLSQKGLEKVRYALNCERGSEVRTGWEPQEYWQARHLVSISNSPLYPQSSLAQMARYDLLFTYLVAGLGLAGVFGLSVEYLAVVLLSSAVLMYVPPTVGAFLAVVAFALTHLVDTYVMELSTASGVATPALEVAIGLGVSLPLIAVALNVTVIQAIRVFGKTKRLPFWMEVWVYPHGRLK